MIFSGYKDLGHILNGDRHIVFFGNRNANIDLLKNEFPHLSFRRLKQTHSDHYQQVRRIDSEMGTEGDALWTTESNIALAINTADCMPILIHSKTQDRVAAIHAGWKGVHNQITCKTLKNVFTPMTALDIYVGPHILFESFEVSEDVKDLLSPHGEHCKSGAPGKFFIDLLSLIKKQIENAGASKYSMNTLQENTRINPDYFSHRREPENKGRQISFIAKI